VLQAVLGDYCARQELAPSLVATSSDVKLLVRARLQGAAPPAESLLTQGWRARHVLPELLAVLEGRRSLRIADVRAESPFDVDDVPPRAYFVVARPPGPADNLRPSEHVHCRRGSSDRRRAAAVPIARLAQPWSPRLMDTDRNLLFAVLAPQADLLDSHRFVEACTLWASQK